MAMKKGQNFNHPPKGAPTKVDPIRELSAIAQIKQDLILANDNRGHCLFTMGINLAFRANELLSLKVGRVRYLNVGDILELKQSKNKKYRATPLNRTVVRAIQFWLACYEADTGQRLHDEAPLFPSRQGGTLSVPTLWGMVKRWCSDAGLKGHYGSHTLRKTWGYHQRINYGAPLSLLVEAYGHSSERETLRYLGIEPAEISELYAVEL